MNSSNPLCCCEYYDKNDEKSHILACCCNCQDLDESFESLITCSRVSPKNKSGMLSTIQDRLRIPWRGGAKQITPDAVFPIIIILMAFLIASISLIWSIIVAVVTLLLLWYLLRTLPYKIPRTKFFFIWSCFSTLVLYFIFEYLVVPLLEILLKENIILGVFTLGFIVCVTMMKKKSVQLQYSQTGLNKVDSNRNMHCSICLVSVPEGDFHSYWFDCCIGQHNQFYYILARLFALFALIYSANLTLTSVCHPYTIYKSILLPDDCSDVYQEMELAVSFVSACYSLVIAALFLITVIHHIVLISLGVTWQEWKEASCCKKTFCCSMYRPYSRGFFGNWYRSISNSFHK